MKSLTSWLVGTLLSLAIIVAGPGVFWYDRHFQGYHFGGVTFLHLLAFTIPPGVGVQLASLKAQEIAADVVAKLAEQKAAQITAAAGARETVVQTRIVTQTRTLVHEIPSTISPQVDRAFPLPWGLVRVHDAAALGVDLSAVSIPAGQSDDGASTVSASAFGAALAGNYGTCHQTAAELSGLQDWIRQQEAVTK